MKLIKSDKIQEFLNTCGDFINLLMEQYTNVNRATARCISAMLIAYMNAKAEAGLLDYTKYLVMMANIQKGNIDSDLEPILDEALKSYEEMKRQKYGEVKKVCNTLCGQPTPVILFAKKLYSKTNALSEITIYKLVLQIAVEEGDLSENLGAALVLADFAAFEECVDRKATEQWRVN